MSTAVFGVARNENPEQNYGKAVRIRHCPATVNAETAPKGCWRILSGKAAAGCRNVSQETGSVSFICQPILRGENGNELPLVERF